MPEKKYTEQKVEAKIIQEIVSLYSELFGLIWSKIITTLGETTLIAVFRRIIKKSCHKHPLLACLSVTEEGIDFSQLKDKIEEADRVTIKESFNTLISELFTFLTQMTGDIFTGELEEIVERHLGCSGNKNSKVS